MTRGWRFVESLGGSRYKVLGAFDSLRGFRDEAQVALSSSQQCDLQERDASRSVRDFTLVDHG